MKAKLGVILVVLGSVLVASALGLFLYNELEQMRASDSVNALMPQLAEAIRERQTEEEEEPEESVTVPMPTVAPVEQDWIQAMPVVEIDGHAYIGFLSIPSQEIEWPIMKDWDYEKLEIAPCRFTGSYFSDNLVIMGHNYRRHFRKITTMRVGDTVIFTDVDGQSITYEVVALDVLDPMAVEDMTAGEYDLTLFTCTYGGRSRLTIRCNRIAT